MNRKRVGFRFNVEQLELAGFLRSLTEVHWLLLVLVLFHFTVSDLAATDRLALVLAMLGYACAVIGFRFLPPHDPGSRWKLVTETAVMLAFITFVLWNTGGTDSPLLNLYILVVIVSAVTLERQLTVLFVGVVASLYLLMAYWVPSSASFSLLSLSHVLAKLMPLLLVAYVTTALSAELRTAKHRYRRLSETDPLTGLYNGGALTALLSQEVERAARYLHPFAVAVIDSDHLKAVNDRYGHEAGNRMIQTIAAAISGCLRKSDFVARYGGDEFVVLLPERTPGEAAITAERIRLAVWQAKLPSELELQAITVSIGIACYPNDAADAQTLLERADAALFLSKTAGRNRVTSYSLLPVESPSAGTQWD